MVVTSLLLEDFTQNFISLRDRASHNDVIGTLNLCMSKISTPGGEIEGKTKSDHIYMKPI